MIMNNRALLVFNTFLAVMLIPLAQGAMAANFELTVFPNEVSVCPCSAITPQHISVSVKNLHHSTDSYTFTLTVPAGWNSQIQKDITLASGEEGSLDLFLVNVGCNVPPGVYTATVGAKSVTTGQTLEETLSIEVLLCKGAELSVVDDHKEVCFEELVPVIYDMVIKNLGKFEETFQLSSSVEWTGFSEAGLTLGAGENKSFSVVLNPVGLPVGLQTVSIYARSTDPRSPLYYTPLSEILEVDVKDCYDFTADIQPNENTVCFGKAIEYTLVIENTGLNEDSYSIYTPDWVTSEEAGASLGPGQKANVKVTATPEILGSQDFSITVTSSKEPGLSKKASSIVVSKECRSVAVIVSPTHHTVCGGMPPVIFDVSVKNTGTVESTYQLTPSLGTLETSAMTLIPGEIKTTRLEVDITGLEEEVTITVSAADDDIYDDAAISLVVENCYAANLTIEPEMQAICPYDSVKYIVTLVNIGKLPDNYTLRYGDVTETLDLNSGELESFELTFLVPFEESGVYVVSSFADSDHVSLTQTAALNVKAMDACYNAELDVETTKKIKPCTLDECDAITLPVEINNTGEKPASYLVSLEGPDWVYMEPTGFDLGSGESDTAYIYLSPEFGVEENTYTITIKAESEHVELVKIVDVVVTENITAKEPGISLNASAGNITGAIVGGERPLWKTIVVAIIALIIIVILAVRFVLLVKK
jgi:hypothetical protein